MEIVNEQIMRSAFVVDEMGRRQKYKKSRIHKVSLY